MPYIRVDIDLDEIHGEMDRGDKELMAEWLADDDISIKPDEGPTSRSPKESWDERELRNSLTLIWNSYHRLTHEEEELIKKIANRL